MAIRFDLETANWLAHVITPELEIPSRENFWEARDTLGLFLDRMKRRFYSSPEAEHSLRKVLYGALERLKHIQDGDYRALASIVSPLREYLTRRPWTALLVPSTEGSPVDREICSERFLKHLVNVEREDPGLILQLDDPPDEAFALTDTAPAFRVALARSHEWPGTLIWRSMSEVIFLPFSGAAAPIEEAEWIFLWLAKHGLGSLGDLEREYRDTWLLNRGHTAPVTILHLSDTHIGSQDAALRLPRLEDLVRSIVEDVEQGARLHAVVTGDLMETPSDDNLDRARSFLGFLRQVTGNEPTVVWGNHDVRRGGIGGDQLGQALQVPTRTALWMEDEGLGFLCFNSNIGGDLGRGLIGERQLQVMGREVEERNPNGEMRMLGLLHHHPIPVARPDWHRRAFYEKLLGSWFEKTLVLEDADLFCDWTRQRRLAAVLHGHKHIPRVDVLDAADTRIVGCGSSVGKVLTRDRRPYLSLNVVTVDPAGRVGIRLLAERVPGGGLLRSERHEFVHL